MRWQGRPGTASARSRPVSGRLARRHVAADRDRTGRCRTVGGGLQTGRRRWSERRQPSAWGRSWSPPSACAVRPASPRHADGGVDRAQPGEV